MRGSRFISRLERCRLCIAYRGCCAYCNRRVRMRARPGPKALDAATIDHVDPRAKALHKRENLVLCCWGCNANKGDEVWKPVRVRRPVSEEKARKLRERLYPGQV